MSDNGPEFNNQLLAEICSKFNVNKINVLPHRPQANGLVERLNSSILNILRTLLPQTKVVWDDLIPLVQTAINSSYHTSLGDIPHYVVHIRDRRSPYDFLEKPETPVYSDDLIKCLLSIKQRVFRYVKKHLEDERDQSVLYQHKLARRKKVEPGVLVFRKVLDKPGPMPKLAAKFVGPYRVIKVRNNKARCLELKSGAECWYHFDTLKLASLYLEQKYLEENPVAGPSSPTVMQLPSPSSSRCLDPTGSTNIPSSNNLTRSTNVLHSYERRRNFRNPRLYISYI